MIFHALLMCPHILDPGKPWCCLLVNQSKLTPHRFPFCGLNLANMYHNISWRLDSPGSIAFTIHLHRRLVLATSGSTKPNPRTSFNNILSN